MNDASPLRMERTISARMAEYAVSLRYEDLPDDVRRLAHFVLLDTLGCALAGSNTTEVRQVRAAARAAGEGGGASALWGTPERAPLPFACLANGTAVHAREMDDFGGCAHSGSVVIPAALGTAVKVGASGRELLTAIVIGYDIAQRAMAGGGGYLPFKARGWHSTSVCGGFGAAAAAGRLLGLDVRELQWALGYAGSNAGGTWAFIPDGAMSKRVHPGLAAMSGVVSALLAESGMTAPTAIFETEWGGFFPTYVGDAADPSEAVDGLGSDFRIRLVGFKPYAACRGIHSSVDAALDLRETHGVVAGDVESVQVRGSRTHVRQLSKQLVTTPLDAQMSLPYSIAVALTTGSAMLDQYTDEALGRGEVNDLAARVTVVHDDRVRDGDEPFLEFQLRNGSTLRKRVLVARGDHANPLTETQLRQKFRTTAGTCLDVSEVAALDAAVSEIADAPAVDHLVDLMVPRSERS